jgi:hypothetical protein
MAYLGRNITAIGIGLLNAEAEAYVLGFKQMEGMELVGVRFGEVTGWKCTKGKAISYLLHRDGFAALLNVEPIGSESFDVSVLEANLHTLVFR